MVGNNYFTGTLPSLGTAFLNFFDARNNQFIGTIPSSLFESAENLEFVYVQGNNLSGEIPSSFANAGRLVDFYASNNFLAGNIPEIPESGLIYLTEFLLDGNSLIGSMPDSICNLRNASLTDLWVDCAPPAEVQCDVPECCTKCFPE